MRQVRVMTPNYACDLSGICSALYELGGLIVMHDASGCNSTFATHDEPRWYDMDSMVYISGLKEYDVVLGNDDGYIDDVVEIALERHPRFVAVFGSPVALLIGTDFRGVARIIERRTGIPTFWFKTSGMQSYIYGARQAFAAIAERLCPDGAGHLRDEGPSRAGSPRVNLLGVTPLDFSVVGNVEALRAFCHERGFELIGTWAMGDGLDGLLRAGEADVNIVVSSLGLDCAETLKRRYGTPFVVGCPIGMAGSAEVARMVRASAHDGRTRKVSSLEEDARKGSVAGITVIGEAVVASSVRSCLERDLGERNVRVICPLEDPCGLLGRSDVLVRGEDETARAMASSRVVIADPLYEVLLGRYHEGPDVPSLLRLPHEAYSGRMFRNEIPRFVGPGFEGELARRLAAC